jgi:hypothetical protein
MLTTNLDDLQGYDLVYGTLWLPSLRQENDVIISENITLAEALDKIEDFSVRTTDVRRCKNFPDNTYPSFAYLLTNAVTNKHIFPHDLAKALGTSDIPTYRGKRAVFISDAFTVIVVGRTVIYNRNWAAVNVLDPSIEYTIQNIESNEY